MDCTVGVVWIKREGMQVTAARRSELEMSDFRFQSGEWTGRALAQPRRRAGRFSWHYLMAFSERPSMQALGTFEKACFQSQLH